MSNLIHYRAYWLLINNYSIVIMHVRFFYSQAARFVDFEVIGDLH